jgi:hypothetical protein
MASTGEQIVLTGVSGQQYTFDMYTLETQFNAVGAVYAIERRGTNNVGGIIYTTVYIGQTSDLSERFDNHHKAACFRRERAGHIGIWRADDEKTKTRLAAEADLIAQIHPVCNAEPVLQPPPQPPPSWGWGR